MVNGYSICNIGKNEAIQVALNVDFEGVKMLFRRTWRCRGNEEEGEMKIIWVASLSLSYDINQSGGTQGTDPQGKKKQLTDFC